MNGSAASGGRISESRLADEKRRIDAGRGIVDPGEAHVAILGEHHDRRAAQSDLEALLGFRQFLGALLDPLFKLLPRILQLIEACADARRSPTEAGRARDAWRVRALASR